MRRGFTVLAVTSAAVVAAAVATAASDPRTMVLTLSDMPTGFSQKPAPASGYKPAALAAKGDTISAATYTAHGYVNGYEADYTRDVSLTDMVSGAIEIDSSVSVYKTSAGATWSLERTKSACAKNGKPLSVGASLGDDAVLCSVDRKQNGVNVRVYLVGWRRGNIRASILTAGLSGGASASQSVALAKKQNARLR